MKESHNFGGRLLLFLSAMLCFLAMLYVFDNKYYTDGSLPVNGVLRLSQQDLTNAPVFLIDDWRIWDDEAEEGTEGTRTWIGEFSNYQRYNDPERSPYGNCTYRLKLEYDGEPMVADLFFPNLCHEYTLWWDGQNIEIEASSDNQLTWKTMGAIDADKNPVDYMPKEEGYGIRILSDDIVDRLLSEGKGTFHVRLKIVNGALGNACELEGGEGDTYTYSQSAVWTGEYTELPPQEPDNGDEGEGEDDTNSGDDTNGEDDFEPGNDEDEDKGSSGNNGNTGTDNSGDTQGQRPGIEQTSPTPEQDETDTDSSESNKSASGGDKNNTDTDSSTLRENEKNTDSDLSAQGETVADSEMDTSLSEEETGNSEDDSSHSNQKEDKLENQAAGEMPMGSDQTPQGGADMSRKQTVDAAVVVIGVLAGICAVGAVLAKLGILPRLIESITKKIHP